MNTALVLAGVDALIKLSNATNKAIKDHAVNDDILFPHLKDLPNDPLGRISDFFNEPENTAYVSGPAAKYAAYWQDNDNLFAPKTDKQSLDTLAMAMAEIESTRPSVNRPASASAGRIMIRQWVDGEKPLSPIARITIAAADIALDYVGSHPGIIGGGNGARLISAYAATLASHLPDDGNLSTQNDFIQSLSGILLRTAFDTVSKNPDWIVSEEHFKTLIERTIVPLVETFPLNSETDKVNFKTLTDTLMGPVTNAILATIADNPQAFLGSGLSADKAIGALTQAVFKTANDIGLEDQFTRDGLVSTYKALLTVVAEKPNLFIESNGEPSQTLLEGLLTGFANVVRQAPYPYNGQLGIELSKTALQQISTNAHLFADPNKPWQTTAAEVVESITTKSYQVIVSNGDAYDVFSEQQLLTYGRIVLNHVAKSPSMLTQTGNKSQLGLINAIATSMASSDTLLLTGDDWLSIVKVAAAEAASNPMRLFNLDPQNPDDILASQLINLLLDVAKDSASQQGKTNVIFGQTLSQAISILLTESAGRVLAATQAKDKLKEALLRLNTYLSDKTNQYGSHAWLALFRQLLVKVLANEEIPAFSEQYLAQLIEGANT